mgnify:CR=1 FL=1
MQTAPAKLFKFQGSTSDTAKRRATNTGAAAPRQIRNEEQTTALKELLELMTQAQNLVAMAKVQPTIAAAIQATWTELANEAGIFALTAEQEVERLLDKEEQEQLWDVGQAFTVEAYIELLRSFAGSMEDEVENDPGMADDAAWNIARATELEAALQALRS